MQKKILKGEIKTYDDYLTGTVYGYEVTDKDGKDTNACWGFYGNYEESGLLEDAKSVCN